MSDVTDASLFVLSDSFRRYAVDDVAISSDDEKKNEDIVSWTRR